MVTSPDLETKIVWSRERTAVFSFLAILIKGLKPAKTLKISFREGSLVRYFAACSNKKSTSCFKGRGSKEHFFIGVSVVPRSTRPCQGTMKRTRLSEV